MKLFCHFHFSWLSPDLLLVGVGGGDFLDIFDKLLQFSSAFPSNFLFLLGVIVFPLVGRVVGGAGAHFLIFT